MKKSRILLVVCLFCATLSDLACNSAGESVNTPPGGQSFTPSPIRNISPAPTTPIPTFHVDSTVTPVPTSLPSASPTFPTHTSAPFLPANLIPISPQNVSRLKPVAVLPEQGASVVAYSPDSRWIAAGLFGTNHVKIWDLASGREQFTLSGHVDPRIISYLAFSPDGSSLASGAQGWDATNDSLILWEANSGHELQRFDGVLGAISPDWRLVALTRREQDQGAILTLSDLSSGQVIHTLNAPSDIYGVSFSPEGQRVAAKMYDVYQDLFSFWSADNGQLERTLYDWVGFSFSPDGRFIAALVEPGADSEKGELNSFEAETFQWVKTLAREADSLWYTYPAFSPDGQILAASLGDRVVLWGTQGWDELAWLPASGPAGLAFSPDGRILTTYTHSGMAQLWGVVGGQ